jgi:hypothetical protein
MERPRIFIASDGRDRVLTATDGMEFCTWRYHVWSKDTGQLLFTYLPCDWYDGKGYVVWNTQGKRVLEIKNGITYSVEGRPPVESDRFFSWQAPIVACVDLLPSLTGPKTYTTTGLQRRAGLRLWNR